MPIGQFSKPEPNKVIAALQKLGNQRPVGINLRHPGQSQHYLGTYLGPEAVDANLSIVRLHGGATIRFVAKLAGLTLVANDVIKLEKSSILPLHIVGKLVGNITLASTTVNNNVGAPGAPFNLAHTTPGFTAIDVSWAAGADHFGSGLTYQVYINGAFRMATGNNILSVHINGLLSGHSYSCYVIAIDGAGNHSPPSVPTGWTMKPPVADDPGTLVTKTYKATMLRSYNHGGNMEHDPWHNGSAYQGAYAGSYRQYGLIFFDYARINADIGNGEMQSASVTLTYAHWANNAGGIAIVGTHLYDSAPSNLGGRHYNADLWHVSSVAGRAFTINMGVGTGNNFKSGAAKGIITGQGPSTSRSYYGYTYGAGSHVPSIKLSWIA